MNLPPNSHIFVFQQNVLPVRAFSFPSTRMHPLRSVVAKSAADSDSAPAGKESSPDADAKDVERPVQPPPRHSKPPRHPRSFSRSAPGSNSSGGTSNARNRSDRNFSNRQQQYNSSGKGEQGGAGWNRPGGAGGKKQSQNGFNRNDRAASAGVGDKGSGPRASADGQRQSGDARKTTSSRTVGVERSQRFQGGGRGRRTGGRGGGSGGRAGPSRRSASTRTEENRSKSTERRPAPNRLGPVDISSRRRSRQNRRAERQQEALAAQPQRQDIFEVGPEGMSVMDLAEMLAVPPVEIVKKLFLKGLAVQVNSTLDAETVKVVGMEYGVDVLDRDDSKPEDAARKLREFIDEDDLEHLTIRPPVVTVMGHVDHGKTSLLDFIRKTKVAAGEAGGITQSIGAYTCDVEYGEEMRQVTLLDTPGHEAFSAMRARGAKVTDIAIIIVAADDGVRPQTLEAISHARAAGVPIVVAINKCDKEGANPERVKQELTEVELIPEEWGGKTPMVNISAKKGQGVDDLLETVLLVAELEELQARHDRHAAGTVLEAMLDRKVGPVATVLVQNGTLRVGDAVAAGSSYGKVRSMRTTLEEVDSAGPSIAVQVLGLNAVPQAGDEFEVLESETRAREAAESVEDARRLERLAEMAGGGSMVTLASLASMDEESDEQALQRMNIILKSDASGSCEAVKSALSTLPQDTVVLRYLLAAPGEITVSDIDLATASGGMVLGFGVKPSESVMAAAKNAGVTIGTYEVIYDLIDDVRAAMEGRLRTAQEREKIGEAEVKAVFGSGSRKVAGCYVRDGNLRRNSIVVVKRGKRVVFEGTVTSLRRVKDDVKEVASGVECGVGVEGFRDWEEGDVIEAYEIVEKKLKLEEAHAVTVEI